jgi:hypothetical protein
MTDWTDEQIDIAARVICNGFPLASHPDANTLAGMIAKGRCMAPNCNCWEQGRALTKAALEAASVVPATTGRPT